MSGWFSGMMLVALLAIIWGFSHALGGAIRRRLAGRSMGVVLSVISRPLLVLAGSLGLLWLTGHFPQTSEWTRYIHAWIALWEVLLVFGLVEGAALWICEIRRAEFPIPPLLRNIARGVVALAVSFALLKYSLGANISPLLASTALITAVVGFALQGVLANLMAGMSLHLVRSVVPGDWVRIDDVEGQVVEMNWRETRVRAVNGQFVILPNSRVAAAQIQNMTHPDSRRRHELVIPIRYTHSPDEVAAELTKAAEETPDVLLSPRPDVLIRAITDHSVQYLLRFWSDRYHLRGPLESEVYRRIWYRLRRRGIETPFPVGDDWMARIRELVLQPEKREMTLRRRQLEALRQSELVNRWLVDEKGNPLISESDLETLAENVRMVRYAAGETIFKQGEPGMACYVVAEGRLRGRVEYSDTLQVAEFELGKGALFGEMSLMTNLPRTATLVAIEESLLVEIPVEAFRALLALRADIPEHLAAAVTRRAEANAETLKRLKNIAEECVSMGVTRKSVLERLWAMLGGDRSGTRSRPSGDVPSSA